MSKRPELVNTKKADGSELDHPRAVNSNSKVILLTVCLYACANVRASKSVRGCLPFTFLRGGGLSLYFFL